MNDSNIPILGAKQHTPSELVIAATCPTCESVIFAHTKTTKKGPAIFPTCGCEMNEIPIPLPTEYDGDRERQTVHLLMNWLGSIFNDLQSYHELYGPLPETVVAEEVVNVTGVVLPD